MDSQITKESLSPEDPPTKSTQQGQLQRRFSLPTPFHNFKHEPLARICWKSEEVIPEVKEDLEKYGSEKIHQSKENSKKSFAQNLKSLQSQIELNLKDKQSQKENLKEGADFQQQQCKFSISNQLSLAIQPQVEEVKQNPEFDEVDVQQKNVFERISNEIQTIEEPKKDLVIQKVVNQVISPQKPIMKDASTHTENFHQNQNRICPQPEMSHQVQYGYSQFLQEKLDKFAENLKDLLVDLNKQDQVNKYLGRKSAGSQIEKGGVVTRASKRKNQNMEEKQEDTITMTDRRSELNEEIREKLPRNKRRKRTAK